MAHTPNGWRSTKDATHFDGVAVVRTLARHDDVAPRCKPFVSVLRTMGVGLPLSDHNLTIICFCSAVGTACMFQGAQGYFGDVLHWSSVVV